MDQLVGENLLKFKLPLSQIVLAQLENGHFNNICQLVCQLTGSFQVDLYISSETRTTHSFFRDNSQDENPRLHKQTYPITIHSKDWGQLELTNNTVIDLSDSTKGQLDLIIAQVERELANIIQRESDQFYLQYYRDLLASVPDIIYEVDAKGSYLYANDRAMKLTEFDQSELKEMTYHQLIHPDDLLMVNEYHRGMIERKELVGYLEFRLVTKKGKVIWIGQNSTLQYDNGELSKITAVSRDNTEIVALREDLKESKDLYKLVTETSRDMISLTKMDGTFIYVSPYIYELIGYKPEEVIGTNGYDLFHPDDLNRIKAEARFQDTFLNTAQYRFRRKDGSYIWVETVNRKIEREGQEDIFQASTRDISQRVAITNSFEQKSAVLESMMENTTEMIFAVDESAKFLFFNSAYRDIYVKRTGKLPEIGEKFVAADDGQESYFKDLLLKVLDGERVFIQTTNEFKDGTKVDLEGMLNPIVDKFGKPVGASAFLKDVTE